MADPKNFGIKTRLLLLSYAMYRLCGFVWFIVLAFKLEEILIGF